MNENKNKLWAGRQGATDSAADDFNSSIRVDSRMYVEDIRGSMAHAAMLGACNIISKTDSDAIISELEKILSEINSGKLEIDMSAEDIHTFIEGELTSRIGDAGRRLHTARSRNDQVALDTRLYLRKRAEDVKALIRNVISELTEKADSHADDVVPGYTHLQRAQPISFGHQLLAYAWMLMRDSERLSDAIKRMNISPLGSCALAGTGYPIDRAMTASALGFSAPSENSIDAVSDRDFIIELSSALSILMMHLSRLSEEFILWSSWEFKYIEFSDAYTTGSSIMPQKKNPDMAELIRGKTGRVYGNLMAILTVMKGLPLAYNKDMQEDKEAIFDSFDTVCACLSLLAPMISSMKVNSDSMKTAAARGFINATDLADYLTLRGMPFRTAYKLVGELVALCISEGYVLETLPMERYKEKSSLFNDDLYAYIDMKACMMRRTSYGGASPDSVRTQASKLRELNK